MCHNFFIHSSVDGHLGRFHVLAIVSSAAMDTGAHTPFSVSVSSEYMPSSGTAGLYGSSAAAAAESLQSCPTLCDPINSSPPGSPISGILQARTLECALQKGMEPLNPL